MIPGGGARVGGRLRLSAATLGVLLGAACGSRDERPTLRIAIWSNYLPDAVVADFEREAGCRVETWNYGDNATLVARLEATDPGLDLACPSDFVLPALVAQGRLRRVEPERLPNRKNVDPAFLARATDPRDEWSVPYTWGTVGLAWRADKLGESVDSWDAFLDPRVEGQAYLLEEGRDAIGAALLKNGHDPNTTDPQALAAAKRTLLSWKPALRGFTGEVKDTLLSGEAWLCQAYNGDVAQAAASRGELRFAIPKEGGILWTDVWVVPARARDVALAHRFVDHVLRPEVGARISEGIRYAVANRAALPLVDPAVRADPVVYAPDDVRARCRPQRDLGAAEEAFSRIWLEVRGGG
jgi:spermidine/putrescine transport system substrate-binding protein